MTLFGAWLFLCLTGGVIFFFIIGAFFLRKEAEWSKLEKTRETWSLLTEIIDYIQGKNPHIEQRELEEEIKKVIAFMNLAVSEEYLKSLVQIAVTKKQ